MLVKWIFQYQGDHIAADVRDAGEDLRLKNCMSTPNQLLHVAALDGDAYVNLNLVKIVFRKEIEEEQQKLLPESETPAMDIISAT